MRNTKALLAALLATMSVASLTAAINVNFGSSNSSIVVNSGANLAESGTLILQDGTLKYTNADDLDASITCTRAQIIKVGSFSGEVTGTYTSGEVVQLGSGEKLIVRDGSTPAAIEVSGGGTATIEGSGSLGGTVTLKTNNNTALNLDLDSTLTQNIAFDSITGTQVTLLNDLALADGVTVRPHTIDGNGFKLILGNSNMTLNAAAMTLTDTDIVLNADMTIGATLTAATTANSITGNGHAVSFATAGLDVNGLAGGFAITDAKLSGMQASRLAYTGGGTLSLTDVVIEDNGGTAFRVLGETTMSAGTGDFLAAAVTWGSALNAELLTDMTLTGAWTLGGTTYLNGNGNTLQISGSGALTTGAHSVYLSNIALAGLDASAYSSSGGSLYMSDVTLIDAGTEAVRIVGSHDASGGMLPAQVTPDTGEFFTDAVTFNNGAVIELLNKVTLTDTWTFSEDTHIDGHGNILDLSSATGILSIASGKTLTLSNVIVVGLGDDTSGTSAGSIQCGGTDGNNADQATVRLSGVTFVLDSDISFDKGFWYIDSDSTFVTGNKVATLAATTSGSRMTVTGCTLWYNTLGFQDSKNVQPASATADKLVLTDWSGSDSDVNGRIARVVSHDVGDIHMNIANAGTEYVSQTTFLYPDISGAHGVQLYLDNSDVATNKDVTVDGGSRAIIFANTSSGDSDNLLIIEENVDATFQNVTLDGMVSANIVYTSGVETDGTFIFGAHSVWKLNRDDSLTRAYTVNTAATSSPCTIDLGGHELTIDATNKLDIAASSKLIIKNGTLNVTGACLVPANDTAEIEFRDVAIKLSAAASLAEYEKVTFSGECRLFGVADSGNTLTINQSNDGAGDDNEFVLSAGARLLIDNDTSLVYANDGTFTMTSNKSTLELRGGTFSVTGDAITLKNGTLIVDHKSTLNGTMTLGDGTDPLSIEIFPGATINIDGSGKTVTYANSDS